MTISNHLLLFTPLRVGYPMAGHHRKSGVGKFLFVNQLLLVLYGIHVHPPSTCTPKLTWRLPFCAPLPDRKFQAKPWPRVESPPSYAASLQHLSILQHPSAIRSKRSAVKVEGCECGTRVATVNGYVITNVEKCYIMLYRLYLNISHNSQHVLYMTCSGKTRALLHRNLCATMCNQQGEVNAATEPGSSGPNSTWYDWASKVLFIYVYTYINLYRSLSHFTARYAKNWTKTTLSKFV